MGPEIESSILRRLFNNMQWAILNNIAHVTSTLSLNHIDIDIRNNILTPIVNHIDDQRARLNTHIPLIY